MRVASQFALDRLKTMTYRGGLTKTTFLERIRNLRRISTNAEAWLWRFLRARQVGGAKFRRQHQYGSYILDVYCEQARLVVEVDGGQHFEPDGIERDAERTRHLEADGLRVLRFTNVEVLKETEAVLDQIWNAVEGLPSP